VISEVLIRLFAGGAKMASAPGAADAMKVSPRRVWAIARMTLLEASRRKVFAILALFAIALLSSTAFFPSIEPSGRLRLMEVWALRAASLFTAIVALFISGWSLPSDFEEKRIYLLVTKPVSKASIFLGKLLGLSLLLAIFVATMGMVTMLFIRGVQLLTGPSFPPMVARERLAGGQFEALRPAKLSDANEEKRSYVTAETAGALVWRYTGLRRGDFGDQIGLESRFVLGSPTDPYRASGTIFLEARGSGGTHRFERFLNTNEEKEWSIPKALLGPDGTLDIFFRCSDSDGFLGASERDLSLFLKPGLFEFAFARGLVLLFLQSMTVLSLTLMASAMLSAPLSILLGVLLYIVGSTYGFVKDGTRDLDRSLLELQQGRRSPSAPEDIPPWFLQFSSTVSKAVLRVVPDFDHFDYSRWLLKDKAVSVGELAVAVGHAMPPVLVLGFLGMLVLAFKDFG
jgi:hypothetical protein